MSTFKGTINGSDLPPEIQRILSRAIEAKLNGQEEAQDTSGPFPSAQAEAQAAQLANLRESYNQVHYFRAGDLIQWKAGLSNRSLPRYGQPVIVLSASFEPVVLDDHRAAMTPAFRETLDIKVAVLDTDGEFIAYHYDSARFEPYVQQ